ncbi:hypothetical protein PM082_008721 [Marasmius tenuissimus]|nr:hypothetical protein PM082_008721 [Marasmius tenuissimus]
MSGTITHTSSDPVESLGRVQSVTSQDTAKTPVGSYPTGPDDFRVFSQNFNVEHDLIFLMSSKTTVPEKSRSMRSALELAMNLEESIS